MTMLRAVRDKIGGKNATATVSEALSVLRIEAGPLYERAVAYVLEGASPELVLELADRDTQDLDAALSRPGRLGWTWVDDGIEGRVRGAASGMTIEKGARARGRAYAHEDVTPEQYSRMGRLMAAIVTDTDVHADVPDWFGVLVQDVVVTRVGGGEKNGPVWTPEQIETVARAGGLDDATAATVQVMLARPRGPHTSSRGDLRALVQAPEAARYLAARPEVVHAQLRRLSAEGKKAFCGFMTAHAVPEELRAALAALCADTSKGVRREADDIMATLPDAERVRLLSPLLESAPASALDDVVTRVAGAEGGVAAIEALLAAARASSDTASGRRSGRARDARAAALARAVERERALGSTAEPEPEIPPYEALPEAELGQETIAAAVARRDEQLVVARETLRQTLEEHQGDARPKGQPCWHIQSAEQRVKQLERITTDDLTTLVAIMSGRQPAAGTPAPGSKGARRLEANVAWLIDNLQAVLPDASPLHVARLVNATPGAGNQVWWAMRGRLGQVSDLRALHDALARAGFEDADEAIADLVFERWWGAEEIPAERMWPYFAERVDVLEHRLTPRDSYDANHAPAVVLEILDHFPVVPTTLLPRLSALAMGSGKTHRLEAQRVLARHPKVLALAEQGLTDGRSAVRASAAAWLANLGDKEAVPALRAALRKERREDARAALLTALESLGEDITDELSVEKLAAEAAKGLRKKAPVSLSWFPLDALPDLRWRDGTKVPREIVRWWVVLAVRLKNPSGEGLLARYVSLLDEVSRETLGSYVLRAWIAQDTRGPSAAESREYAERVAQQQHAWSQQWLAQNPGSSWAQERAAIGVDEHYRRAYRDHQATYLGSATKDKGLLALTVGMPGTELATAAQHYFKAHPQRRSQADTLVRALAANGDRPAVQLLLAVSRQFKLRTVRELAGQLAGQLAEARGWTADQLADRTVQTAGFDADGVLRLSFGTRAYTGRITDAFTIELRNDKGKVVRTPPSTPQGADEDTRASYKDARSQLTVSKKELKTVAELQSRRLREAMILGRTWSAAEWREFVAEHPVMSRLAARVVWLAAPGTPGQRAFRPDDGALVAVDDEDVTLDGAGDEAVVGIAHATTLGEGNGGADTPEAWREHLADYEVEPLFEQFRTAIPDMGEGALRVTDRRGWLTDSYTVRGRLHARGYRNGEVQDAGWFYEYTKEYPSAGLVAEIEFTGAFMGNENIPAAVKDLTFRKPGTWGEHGVVPLADVPHVLLAETYADYLDVASAGAYDPDWERKSEY
ncbi:DUF4132 domain-containing protein [Myceligenerans indicum]|uniref:DUF4132 domain-containing protein n=1 Tax=Myceligenerans indicum TaxID=2593663 RepID=A0ABS1LRD9_9MICO|nr:DUF4132 domain-containing protein [Myceligenerans indicum]MBL0888579.1 DUF4132 domain-containing protein [Myceligenerans indicum]